MNREERAQASLFCGGWSLVTAGLSVLFPRIALAVWLLSAGLLLLTILGWRVILEVVCGGLYAPEPVAAPVAPPPTPVSETPPRSAG